MRRAGVSPDTKVVAYDDAGGAVAARLWFLLGYFGHGAQAVLDGGLGAWGGPLSTDPRSDLETLLRRALFAWLVADGDMHLKKAAFQTEKDSSRAAPAPPDQKVSQPPGF